MSGRDSESLKSPPHGNPIDSCGGLFDCSGISAMVGRDLAASERWPGACLCSACTKILRRRSQQFAAVQSRALLQGDVSACANTCLARAIVSSSYSEKADLDSCRAEPSLDPKHPARARRCQKRAFSSLCFGCPPPPGRRACAARNPEAIDARPREEAQRKKRPNGPSPLRRDSDLVKGGMLKGLHLHCFFAAFVYHCTTAARRCGKLTSKRPTSLRSVCRKVVKQCCPSATKGLVSSIVLRLREQSVS